MVDNTPPILLILLCTHLEYDCNRSSFTSMTRIYKHYDFPMGRGGGQPGRVPARHITFPSYPGCAYSNDDWYQTDAGLAITETTINNNNGSLWQFVTHQTLLDWVRNSVANRLASSGAEWAELFGRHNSGTYNNQVSPFNTQQNNGAIVSQVDATDRCIVYDC
jgi:hypothetical protein